MKMDYIRARGLLSLTVAIMMICAASPAMTFIKSNAYSSKRFDWQPALIGGAAIDVSTRSKIVDSLARLPLSFEENTGQAGAHVKFISRGDGYALFLGSTEMNFAFGKANRSDLGLMNRNPTGSMRETINSQSQVCNPQAASLRMKFKGARSSVKIIGSDKLLGKSNYFIGNDPERWQSGVESYGKVKYESIYHGIDLIYYGKGRELEYDFKVAPGADYRAIRVEIEGAQKVRVEASGELVIETWAGQIRQPKPVIYQEAEGGKEIVEGGYRIKDGREVGFEIGDYDRSRRLVIDPVLIYSTSIGGSQNDNAYAIAVDAAGNAYVAGSTASADFPTVNPFQSALSPAPEGYINVTDAFVMKLSPTGALVYSTYLGGGKTRSFAAPNDGASAIAVDRAGNAYVTGFAASSNFPTTSDAFQTTANDTGDAFVAKLNPAGNRLVYSTRLGGAVSASNFAQGFAPATTVGTGIGVDGEGNAYVAGYTFSSNFPTKRAAQNEFNKGMDNCCCCYGCFFSSIPGPAPSLDSFVAKLNPAGSGLVYSTFLGGTNQDQALAIAVDSSGSAYVTGRTCSTDFPGTTGHHGGSDAFLTKISPSGSEFIYSKLIGGSGSDVGNAVALDQSGNAYITGETNSTDFQITQGALQAAMGGGVFYETEDAGTSWNLGTGLPNIGVNALAVDPTNPSTVFAAVGATSLYKSTDGGQTWKPTSLDNEFILAVAVDPKNSSVVYAGQYKSTDGGSSWTQLTFASPSSYVVPSRFVIDPTNSNIVYLLSNSVAAGDIVLPPEFLKSTDGGATWKPVRNGNSVVSPARLIIDPKNSSRLYASGLKSTDGGATWTRISAATVAIDPVNTSILYGLASNNGLSKLIKSTDGGDTWSDTGLDKVVVTDLVIDPVNPLVLYVATGQYVGSNSFGVNAVIKSTDGGATWNTTDLSGFRVNQLAINPLNPSKLVAAAEADADAFIAKINATGDGLIYSTYWGTRGKDSASGIGVDKAGNAYVTGRTTFGRFPLKDDLLAKRPNGPFLLAAFVTKLNAAGSDTSYSTFINDSKYNFGSAIAIDPTGAVYIAGSSASFVNDLSLILVSDTFTLKLSSPPRIVNISTTGKNLIVTGEGFASGAVILINNLEQKTRNDETNPTTVLVGKKAVKTIAPGQQVSVQVRNPDGTTSDQFAFRRPAE